MASLYALYAVSSNTHKLPCIKTFEKVKVFDQKGDGRLLCP
jgi:hypothetical protein